MNFELGQRVVLRSDELHPVVTRNSMGIVSHCYEEGHLQAGNYEVVFITADEQSPEEFFVTARQIELATAGV